MSRMSLPAVALVSLVVGPVMFARSFRDLRTRRLIQNTPTARIRSMAMGLAEIKGSVAARSTVQAPFSGRTCAYWEVDIATQGKRNSWTIVHRNSSGHPFFVSDDTGVALVYPSGAECKVRFGREEVCMGVALPECYARYMSDEALAMRGLWRLSSMRFRERTLDEGQQVYILGTATPRAHSVDLSGDMAFAATGTDGGAGAPLRTLDEQYAAVIRRGENETTYIISQESERELAMDLGLHAFGGLVGGPLLTLFGLAYWLMKLSTGFPLRLR